MTELQLVLMCLKMCIEYAFRIFNLAYVNKTNYQTNSAILKTS